MIRTASGSRQSSGGSGANSDKTLDRWSSTDSSYDLKANSKGTVGSTPPSPGFLWKSRATVRERRPSLERTPSFRSATGINVESHPHIKDLEGISYLEKEAYFALRYLQDVVEKNTTELLAGSTTVVVENIFVLDSHIQNTLHHTFKEDPVIKTECKEVYRYLAVLVHWSDQVLLRRTEPIIPMRRHNQIVPAIQALRKHISLLVERYRKGALLRPVTPPILRTAKLPLSASAESLSPSFQSSSSRTAPWSATSSGYDEIDHSVPNGSTDKVTPFLSASHRKNSLVPSSAESPGGCSFSLRSAQVSPVTCYNGNGAGTHSGSISSSISSLQSRSPSPQLTSPIISRNPPSDDSGISLASSRHRPLDNLPPRPLGKNGSITSLNSKSDLTALVSSLFPPRTHKPYLRQASLGVEPIYYDNLHERVPPLPPKKQRNVISYVEVFGPDSLNSTPSIRPKLRSDKDFIGIPKRLSFDEVSSSKPLSRSVTPELKRFSRERKSSDKEISEELSKILGPFESDLSQNNTLVRNKTGVLRRSGISRDETSLLSSLDCYDKLIYPRTAVGRGELKGGPIDALIVEATKATKKDFAYQEAFITTYRTFIASEDLVDKLLYRYTLFSHSQDQQEKAAARSTFTLLLRVVEELCLSEIFRSRLIDVLLTFVEKLLVDGELAIARGLRRKILDKHELDWKSRSSTVLLMTPSRRSRRIGYLLDFKSQDLAEQMTLMDAELLSRIELTELLSWTKEQSEDAGLNLSQFTEHFNKVSFWARTRILEQTDQRDREKYFCKFMKIMRCLRKVQNLNSYLAILSAVDSAPVRRLSHSKTHLEALKDLGELIDSSQSFRAYRLVLAQMEPPCIPYIGIALQDLTFVNENPDWLDEGKTVVNFGKRWQQYHILSHLARLQKTCQFTFQRNENIVQFFNNFDSFLPEEALWQISEAIRPRGRGHRS